jgi:hypothetical protein
MKTRIIIIIAIFLAGFYYAKNEHQISQYVNKIITTTHAEEIGKAYNDTNPPIPYEKSNKGDGSACDKKLIKTTNAIN